jgi:hypothetical protein
MAVLLPDTSCCIEMKIRDNQTLMTAVQNISGDSIGSQKPVLQAGKHTSA